MYILSKANINLRKKELLIEHWYSLEIVDSEYINDRVVHSSDLHDKADRLKNQWTDRYLFHNRKTRHKSAPIQSSLENVRDCSNRVPAPQQLPGAAAETLDNRCSLNNDCIALEQTVTRQHIFAGITEEWMICVTLPNIPSILWGRSVFEVSSYTL